MWDPEIDEPQGPDLWEEIKFAVLCISGCGLIGMIIGAFWR
jgi:hypothetical protein